MAHCLPRTFLIASATLLATTLAIGQPPPPPQPPPQPLQQYPPPEGRNPAAPPPAYQPSNLDPLLSRIALYPDQLLSQVLAAATFPDEIPEAARWADQHSYLQGEALARAIQDDHLPFDPSVQALIPFRTVLDMMAGDLHWTNEVGNAFLMNRDAVMDTVQRLRHQAMDYGYLRSNGQIAVNNSGGYVEILPSNPAFVPVPVYDPGVVFVRPRPGFLVGGAVTFGGVSIGAAFAPWGWGYNRFDWGHHGVIIANHPWDRRWENRREYVHPYNGVRRWEPDRRVERHDIRRH
jgi:hypothetical protein